MVNAIVSQHIRALPWFKHTIYWCLTLYANFLENSLTNGVGGSLTVTVA